MKKARFGGLFSQLVKKLAAQRKFFSRIVFGRTCAGQKHLNPPIFLQKNGETGPQAGANLSKRTQRSAGTRFFDSL